MKTSIVSALMGLALAATQGAGPQGSRAPGSGPGDPAPTHWVVPQIRAFARSGSMDQVGIQGVEARVEILEQVATTTLVVTLHNPGPSRAEAVLLLPVPHGATVSRFDFEGASGESTAQVLPADEAREVYEGIVARVMDPALLEFAGYRSVRSSVFPVPAGGKQKVMLAYEHVLERDGLRVDYVLPRSESLGVHVPWKIDVDVRVEGKLSTTYSPSHPLHIVRHGKGHLKAVLAGPSSGALRKQEPGAFRMSYLMDEGGMSTSLMSYPDPDGSGGYFLLLAGLPREEAEGDPIPRELTLVIDRSGSMSGPKINQAKAAALQVLEGLRMGEWFQVLVYSDAVECFSPVAVKKTEESMALVRRYVGAIQSNGGTNIHAALEAAVTPALQAEGALPLVLFLTDGLATVGETGEHAIASMVETQNRHGRRIFTFGVGHDVNAPLLDRLADDTRATSTYVMPEEHVEVAVGKVFRRLKGPILADLELETLDGSGDVITTAVSDMLPGKLPDLFDGDQLILLGRYTAPGPLAFRLQGKSPAGPRTYAFEFDTSKATTKNAFVSRLWASRKIAYLVDQIRRAGADAVLGMAERTVFDDPRFRELADEVLRLSTRFGILSEFTSFLATEGTDLAKLDDLQAATCLNLDQNAVQNRWGQQAVNQSRNYVERLNQCQLNVSNEMWSADGTRVETTNVQQVADQTFFQRGRRWIDGRAVGEELEPHRTVEFGTEAYRELMGRFIEEGRQGILSLEGEILIQLDGERILIVNAGC